MSIQEDMNRLINEAMDAYETTREKLNELQQLNDKISHEIDKRATVFIKVQSALDDIYSEIESLDA